MKDRIIVFGSANVDFLIKTKEFPNPGGVIGDGEFTQMSGGTGVNQIISVAKAGGDACFIGAMGDDIYADKLILELMEQGVNTNHVLLQQDVPTGIAVILVNENGENMVSVAPGANAYLSIDHIKSIDEDFIKNSAYIVVQLEVPKETVEYIINLSHKCNVPLLLNFSPVVDLDPSLFSKVNILMLNEGETKLLTGIDVSDSENLPVAVNELKEKGFSQGIINIGEKGAYIFNNDVEKHIPSYAVDAVDTAAAGDAFCGHAIYKLVNGSSLEEAVAYANAAGALAVTKFGPLTSLPSKEEVEKFISEQ